MTEQHPITPPSDLFRQWEDDILDKHDSIDHVLDCAWRHGFRTGAAKPPSLKEQALEALKHAPGPDYPNPITLLTADEHALIRRALEQLNDD